MSVISPRTLDTYVDALTALAGKFFSKTQLILSGDEFVSAFINPDHVAKLAEVQALVGYVGTSYIDTMISDSEGRHFKTTVGFVSNAPMILPRYIANGMQPTVPAAVDAKISAWVEERVRFGFAFGDTIDALRNLNDSCGDLRAMSVMLPCLPTIMGQISDDSENKTVKRARKLSGQRSYGTLPKLPAATKKRLLEVSAIVNSVTLALDAPDQTGKKHDAVIHSLVRQSPEPDIFGSGARSFV